MKRLRRLWPGLIITLLGLPLLTPLLRWTAVTCTHDGHLHYHRVAAMRHAWENGLYFSRWLPDLAFGYGYPFFVYRELPPLYAVLFPHLLGLPLPAATNLFYGVTILACGWFMFLWVRDVLGTRAALVSAVAYMAAPYTLIDALIRGNSPESLALPLFPLLLWAGRRWVLNGRFTPFLIATLSLALLSLSHNISLLIFTPTLFVYLLAIGWHQRIAWRPLCGRVVLLFSLGLGMTAAYTGGALLEMDQVTLQQSTTTRNNDFRFNFASPGEIFGLVPPEDPNLINPPLPIRLGWVPVGLALLGVLLTIDDLRLMIQKKTNRQSSRRQFHALLAVVLTAVYLFMALPISRWLWEALPLIDFVQFPWRFVGRAALPIAFLAGLPFALKSPIANPRSPKTNDSRLKLKDRVRLPVSDYRFRITAVLAVALLLLEAIPGLYPNVCAEEAFPTINDVHAYERITGLVGVDPEGSYFPRTVEQRPTGSPLEAAYQAGATPPRFDETTVPAGARLETVAYDNLGVTVTLTTPEPFMARYLSFDFPGWTATINGEEVRITPSDPEGLITFPVPAGSHTITVAWQSTPLRTTLLGLSLLALAATAVIAFILYDKEQSAVISNRSQPAGHRPPTTDYRLLTLTALLILAVKVGVVDRSETPLRRAASPPVTMPLSVQGGEIRVDGYSLSRQSVPGGATFDIDLAWTAVSPPDANYQSNVWLADADGVIWSDLNTQRPRLYETAPPTLGWSASQWGWDSREVRVLPGTPPGVYDLVFILFDLQTLQPLTLTDPNGAVLGPQAVIGQVEVTLPAEPPSFSPQVAVDTAVPGSGLTLLGASQDRAVASPGENLLLTLFWEKTAADGAGSLPLHLVNNAGDGVQSWEVDTFGDVAWQPGDRLRGRYALRLAASLDSGSYRFRLGENLLLGELTINAPDRTFTRPDADTAVTAPFTTADGTAIATLAGYTISNLEPQLSINLIWQAEATSVTAYHVFIHLVDNSDQLIAQADGQPANWTRPTTGWVPGEYIRDSHTVPLPEPLPAGPLRLRVGLYDPASGQRLLTPDGDAVILSLP